MADETYRWKGAVEPASGVSTVDTTYRWKGAIEPQSVEFIKKELLRSFAVPRASNY